METTTVGGLGWLRVEDLLVCFNVVGAAVQGLESKVISACCNHDISASLGKSKKSVLRPVRPCTLTCTKFIHSAATCQPRQPDILP